jgi:hypothetical protein
MTGIASQPATDAEAALAPFAQMLAAAAAGDLPPAVVRMSAWEESMDPNLTVIYLAREVLLPSMRSTNPVLRAEDRAAKVERLEILQAWWTARQGAPVALRLVGTVEDVE